MWTASKRVTVPINPQPRRVDDAHDGTWEWLIPGVCFDDLTMAYHLREYAERTLSGYPYARFLKVVPITYSTPWAWVLEVTDGYPNSPN